MVHGLPSTAFASAHRLWAIKQPTGKTARERACFRGQQRKPDLIFLA